MHHPADSAEVSPTPESSRHGRHDRGHRLSLTTSTQSKAVGEVQELASPASTDEQDRAFLDHGQETRTYRVYKRRFFGLAQLTLLNIVVSWAWLTFAANSSTSAAFFETSVPAVNWLSTAFLLAFVFASPLTIYVLNRGVKTAILTASVLICAGNWIRYAGCRARPSSRYGVVMFGQILIGLAQPFVLAAPPRYSEQWFTPAGRIAATALPSLANPFGGALAQLIDPLLASRPSQIPLMVLVVSVVSSVACLPSLFTPAAPPSPPCASAARSTPALRLADVLSPFAKLAFHLLFWPFAVYVSAFNAFSTVINNVLYPYDFSETEAGVAGAVLIVAGLVVAAVVSPVLDRRTRLRIPFVKLAVPLIAAMYLALVWVPESRSDVALYITCGVLGAASFSLMPIALEFIVDSSWPVGAEVTSTISWTSGQLGGAVLIIILNNTEGLDERQPPGNLKDGMIILAVLSFVALPLPMLLGYFGTGRPTREEAGHVDG